MSLDGARVLDRIEVVLETDVGGDAGDPGKHLLGRVATDRLHAHEVVEFAAVEVERGIGRELEAVVFDLDRWPVARLGEGRDSRLEISLADVAPRACHVRPD